MRWRLEDNWFWLRHIGSRVHEWWRDDFLGPRNKWRFKARIAVRVRWLRLRQWVKSLQPLELAAHLPRPIIVLLVFALTVWVLVDLGVPVGHLRDALSTLAKGDGDDLSWQGALVLVGAPVAFVFWLFRDIHANQTLANQRKDINLKEFQEIQMRAAGALDEKLPAKARETLQIAAIHQLRPFLKGEYGDSFRRPAWEFMRARLQASSEATGEAAIVEWVERGGFPEQEGESRGERAERNIQQIREAIGACQPGPVTRTVRAVVREEARAIFQPRRAVRKGWCVATCFDGVTSARRCLPMLIFRVASWCALT
ncbi:hypothetical protein ACLB0R_10885 [Sphingomonas sp. GlSt437]|uniref:hypothetical protein n=1 Tax=Sphingomonas sp. GlSt437 TaxID=3389970 RepID=UPI003A890D36